MTRDPINVTRYRTLRVVLVLLALLAVGAALTLLKPHKVHYGELAIFFGAAGLSVLLLRLAGDAVRNNDRVRIERIASVGIGIGCALVLERIVVALYGSQFTDPRVDLFRLQYACAPLLYLACVAVLRPRTALRLAWSLWAVIVAVTLPGLYLRTGFDFGRPGLVPLLVWLGIANPLFIMILHALPEYEEQLDQRQAEVESMRGRTDLMEKLSESDARFNLVVEGLDVGVWDRWVGPPERRWWSPRFFELIGYSPSELSPTEENLRGLLHPEDRDTVWKAGTEQLKKGNVLDVDFRLRTRNRGYRWFNSRARAQRDASGRLLRLAGSLTDIHERRMAEDALHAAQIELTRLAYRDTLTNLYNRRYFDEHFQREWERARRSRQPLALVLLDLDHFKSYNDHYGHPAGDACLVEFAKLLQRCGNRAADLVARLGGEEFGLVLPATTALGAEEVAQRLRTLLLQAALPHEAAPKKVVTFSAGIAAIETPDGPGPAELFEQADRALYVVKRRGRDGVLRYGTDTESTGQHTLFRGGAA